MPRALIVVVALLAAVGAVSTLGWALDPFGWRKASVARAKAAQAHAEAERAVAEADSAVDRRVVEILERAEAARTVTVRVQTENSRAIHSTQGAHAAVGADLADRLPRGLCRYAAAAADPVCAGLRQEDHPDHAAGDAERAGPKR